MTTCPLVSRMGGIGMTSTGIFQKFLGNINTGENKNYSHHK